MSDSTSLPLHIVVGGGPSGITLCAELAKFSRVLLVEEGPSYPSAFPSIHWGQAAHHDLNSRFYISEPINELTGRQLLLPVGIGIGGSSRINAMIFSGGHEEVYRKYWPATWARRLPELLQQVRDTIKPIKYTAQGLMQTALHVASMEALQANDTSQVRPDLWQDSVLEQHSINDNYFTLTTSTSQRKDLGEVLVPHVASGRISVIRGRAVRVLEGDGQATGVEVQTDSNTVKTLLCENHGEVVLCAGVFGTPRLLYNSHLSVLEDTYQNLGSTLRDHTLIPLMAMGFWWGRTNPLHDALVDVMQTSSDAIAAASNQQCVCCIPGIGACNMSQIWSLFVSIVTSIVGRLFGCIKQRSDCPNATSLLPPNGVHGWVYLNADGSLSCQPGAIPKFQLLLVDGRIAGDLLAEAVIPRLSRPHVYRKCLRPLCVRWLEWIFQLSLMQWVLSFAFGFLICDVQPSAPAGHVRFTDNSTNIIVNATCEEDITAASSAMETARSILHNARSKGLWCVEVLPGPLFLYTATATLFRTFFALFATSYFHYCGTCSMDTGDGCGVVNPDLRVKGIKHLRIADASVIPHLPSAPPSAVCMCIGQWAGEMIREAYDMAMTQNNDVDSCVSLVSSNSSYFDEFDEACIQSDEEENYVVEA